ncbi:ATP-dependent helicase [Pseudonocardiaceae bacterium YIM PH 21723]|nr:ATP-dependent helicase [Pseudonocardiaceae bacterium YIM PH 21723]
MNFSNHERRQLEKSAEALLAERAGWLDSLRRNVLSQVLIKTATNWELFVRPEHSTAEIADAFVVGANGITTLLIRQQVPDDTTMAAVARHSEQRCADIPGSRGRVIPSTAVRHRVILDGSRGKTRSKEILSLLELDAVFQVDARVLGPGQIGPVADHLATRLKGYQRLTVHRAERAEPETGLLDSAELVTDHLAAALDEPFDSWMIFLHPEQNKIVRRDWKGPARISGPAGTGKTVVALHRLKHLARNSTGPLLFTTFVRSLPVVFESTFARLAPEVADRVRFVNLHAWIRELLVTRDRPVEVDRGQVNDAFARAWLQHRDQLEPLAKTGYWQTEIDRVIKGRGLREVDEYLGVFRKGRRLILGEKQRRVVWELYESYQRNLAEKGLHDFNDLITLAEQELAERPLETPYSAVVVDEAQDITLTGLRLLRDVAGEGPNRLLLIGDGQQQVYSGGWRLSDAGISIMGRGEVLRVNYRNRSEVLEFAQRFDARNEVDDLDGGQGVALQQADSANSGGRVDTWSGTDGELAAELVKVIEALPVPRGNTVLISSASHLGACIKILRDAGIPATNLDHYTGAPDDTIKIGTVHRAKGLDFQAVLSVTVAEPGDPEGPVATEDRELRSRQHLVAATRARDYLWWAEVRRP